MAIKHGQGPLLIIAGAGTGKTTVITERVKYLVEKGLAKPEEILALTFTEKGAKEMEERIDVALPLSYGNMWIMTFHSFCDRVLRESIIEIGLSSNYKLMTFAESIDLVKRHLFDFNLYYYRPLGNPNKFIEGLLQHFSRLQDELVSPESYLSFSKSYKNEEPLEVVKIKELASAYKTYNDLKIKENVMDFGDLITYTHKLFSKRPNILKKYQQKFKYILVDEFQDTNFAQNTLINLLAQKEKNITVVGDDNQSIYRFRGAAISNIIQFKKTYPEAKVVTLNKNYRSTQTILDGAYKLIKHNDPDTLEYQLGISKKLNAVGSSPAIDINLIHTKNGQEEAEEISKAITQLTKKLGYDYKDIAVLVRANNHADSLIREFERQGIPHQFLGPTKLFEKEEIVDLISYLKILYNPEDSSSLYRVLSSDFLNLSSLELIKLMSLAKKKSNSLLETIVDSENEKIVKLLKIIDKHLKVIKKETAGQILFDYINEVGIYKKMLEDDDDVKAKNIAKFFEKIKSYEDENRDAGVFAVVDYIDLLMEVGESPSVTDGDWQENNMVNILTVHSSKGLEFPVVFLVNLVSERFPSRERYEQIPIPIELVKEILPSGDFHLQEERRLFYVGMTRAKERLYFTAAQFYGDGKREKKLSPFITEALGETTKSLKLLVDNGKKINYEKSRDHASKAQDKQKTKVDFLSVSQIETFQVCPLHYKLKYIYKLPTEPTASISFGISMHDAMRDFYKAVIEGQKPTKRLIIKSLSNNWHEEGFKNKKHKEMFLAKGKKYLEDYLRVSFDPKKLPSLIEEKFSIRLNDSLKIGGTFDRVDKLKNGGIEIIDYKTGEKVPTQKEVDKDLQLSMYALAATKQGGEVYSGKVEDIKLSLYYFEGQQKITTRRTKEDLKKLENEILEIKKEIETSDFKCSNHFFCQQGCEFSMFCRVSS